MNIVIINYNAGNTSSVQYALERLGASSTISDNAETISNADKVIFPGVGEASSAMAYLRAKSLDETIRSLTQPVLGICLGMQLLCRSSQEGNTPCLSIFNADVKRFLPQSSAFKVPQTGWNNVSTQNHPLFRNIANPEFMYFVHSYYAPLCEHTIAITDYVLNYSSALQNKNFYGVQFHPEKSGNAGQQLLQNFLNL